MSLIQVKDLQKHFVIQKREPGIRGIVKGMVRPNRVVKKAVDGISFSIEKGEIIGFIGPNGAGKSTTIKMLSGILVPTDGVVQVDGLVPYQKRKENARNIGVVFGQRTQLWWNLPVRESLDLLRTIYKVPMEVYQKNVQIFGEILEIDKLMDIPVRQLSLGQRMRVEIAASLLHNPRIVYLDEPTIGLDVVAKEKIREFITEINQETDVTIILTTHDMSDIEKLCQRIVIIDQGRIVYDGNINQIKEQYGKERVLEVEFEEIHTDLGVTFGQVIKSEGARKWILFNRDQLSAVELVNRLSQRYRVKDFALHETEIENIIKNIYQKRVEWKIG